MISVLLLSNFLTSLFSQRLDTSWDFNLNTSSAIPRSPADAHATKCAGEIAATINDLCGVGIAPRSRISSIRLLGSPNSTDAAYPSLSPLLESEALLYRSDANDIYSCSWGPPDTGFDLGRPSSLVSASLLRGVTFGRNGLGNLYVIASGNGGVNDNCNFDGYANSIFTVTIGAVGRNGFAPGYAEKCDAILASAFTSNYEMDIVREPTSS
jgi:kexin